MIFKKKIHLFSIYLFVFCRWKSYKFRKIWHCVNDDRTFIFFGVNCAFNRSVRQRLADFLSRQNNQQQSRPDFMTISLALHDTEFIWQFYQLIETPDHTNEGSLRISLSLYLWQSRLPLSFSRYLSAGDSPHLSARAPVRDTHNNLGHSDWAEEKEPSFTCPK